ncbi:MAG: nucleotidyltransferase domain-containing protein [Oligoflexia bacterium]|nr:nucleotidyltransferase domain-containing protein [Oligoflexia bacterium]
MSILIKSHATHDLTSKRYANIISDLTNFLGGKVEAAYIFGSLATNTLHAESDIDLIIVKETKLRFIHRWEEFEAIFDLFPDIDLLVYTPAEFSELISSKDSPFWRSIATTMKKIV